MTELSDELLVAYVDGQLVRDQTRAVDKVLEQDDVIARRVDALKEAHARLESAFEAILAGEVVEVLAAPMLPPRIERQRGDGLGRVGLTVVGIGLALAALVGGYGWPLITPDRTALRQPALASGRQPVAAATPAPKVVPAPITATTWQEQVLRAQALLFGGVEVGLEGQGNLDLVAFQLAQAIRPAVKLPDLQPQGFKFVRARLLRFGDTPLAQILYLGAEGALLAVYAMRGSGDGEPAFRQAGAIGSVSWSDDGIAYLLIGEEDETALFRLAEKIKHEPAAPGQPALAPAPRSEPRPELSQVPAEPGAPASYPVIRGSAPTSRTTPPN